MRNKVSRQLTVLARDHRSNATPAEALLWKYLKGHHFTGIKFRRQEPLGAYIADFACVSKKLVIEIDGEYHLKPEQQEYDKARTDYLKEMGFTVLRFTNNDVLENIGEVLKVILKECNKENKNPLL
jgi:very-short-patch-repair endonuclease